MSGIKSLAVAILLTGLFVTPVRAEIVIGVSGPMTGGSAAFGEEIDHGAELATETINRQGGLLGQKVRLLVEDDACDPKQAREVANKMVSAKAIAVLGHWCAHASMPASAVYAEEGLIQLEPGALLSQLTRQGFPNLFRVSATDKFFAAALGSYIADHNPKSRIAIVTDRVAVTTALTQYLRSFFAASPNQIVAVEQMSTGEKDFLSIIDRLKTLHPDVVICACFTMEAGLLGRQMAEKRLDAYYYGWDTFTSPDFLHIVGNDKVGKTIMIDYARPPASESYKDFLEELQKKKWPVETTTIISYAAMQLFADAVRKANNLNPAKIAGVLHAEEFDTIIGKVKFDSHGDRIKPDFGAYRWIEGALKNTGQVAYRPIQDDP